MTSHFYYLDVQGKKRFILEDCLDSEDFDFWQSVASDIDKFRLSSTERVDLCLSLIDRSWRADSGTILNAGGA